jgi:hypothetical protein
MTLQAKIITIEEAQEAWPGNFQEMDGELYVSVDSDASGNCDWQDDPVEPGTRFLQVTENGNLKFLFGNY